uniref:Uncharacterized protein n=1 Tax=Musca domestica TaxID=7370 RepID=A0A1I8N6L6_MUSDO
MDNTPKLQRRSSLSLSTRLNNKRHSASPQTLKRTAGSNSALGSRDSNGIKNEVTRSPSIISISSDGGIECCTPPHKKIGMCVDDCGDYSPKLFDSSFSPSCLLSQTLAIDSPEVGWKWSRYSAGSKEELSSRTPDSAYAADSSFTSAGSSSTEITNARTRERLAYDALREQQIRKVEKTRADQKLKQRCAKLQEQLKSAGTQKSSSSTGSSNSTSQTVTSTSSSSTPATISADTVVSITQSTPSTVKMASPPDAVCSVGESIDDFFNDSDEDCFLLAATQEVESMMNDKNDATKNCNKAVTPTASSKQLSLTKINEKPFPSKTDEKPSSSRMNDKSSSKMDYEETTASIADTSLELADTSSTSCASATKEKRSSFYMKFLEDDCPDDWFVSLDEIIEKATQTKKPRTSFQRYKSLPMNNNNDVEGKSTIPKVITYSDPVLNGNTSKKDTIVEAPGKSSSSASTTSSSSVRSVIKRHSSSHALSPSNANYRRRQHQ